MDIVHDIEVPCMAEGIGLGKLTTKHPEGDMGKPVFVAEGSDKAFGPSEVDALMPIKGQEYSEDQLEYIRVHGLQIQGDRAWYMDGWAPSKHVCKGH